MNFEPTRLYATLIDRLSDVPGVVAAAAFDESGRCLSCFVGQTFEELGAGRVIPILQELAAPSDPKSPFEEGVTFVERHLVRVLLRRAVTSTLIALVDPEADVDLVVAHLGRAVDQVARASRPPPPARREAPRTESGFYLREDVHELEGLLTPDAPAPGRIVDGAVLEALEKLSAEALGFTADAVFERARTSVSNLAHQVPRARWVELVGRLASEIEDDDGRDTFLTRALALPTCTRTRNSNALELLSPLARWVVERRNAS